MSLIAIHQPVVKPYQEAVNEILSIQKAAIIIQSNKIQHKVTVRKSPVDEVTMDYLSVYFSSKIQPADQYIDSPYLVINADSCKIIVSLKKTEHEYGSR